MPLVSLLTPVLAIALSATAIDLQGTTLSAVDPGLNALEAIGLGALPPPPEKAVLVTQTFGTITLDHRAHLSRRHACKSCHNPGPVGKIGRLPPKVAHDRCLGCHRQYESAPTVCRDCHVKQTPSADGEALADGAQNASQPGVVFASAPGAPAPPGATLGATGGPVPYFPPPDPGPRRPFTRIIHLGYSVIGSSGQQTTTGPAIFVSSREGLVMLQFGLEHGTATGATRTMGHVGAGVTLPIRWGFTAHALAVGGFDAMESPTNFSPTLGTRLGIEWLGRRVSFNLTGGLGTDLSTNRNAFGQETGALHYSIGATIGYAITRD